MYLPNQSQLAVANYMSSKKRGCKWGGSGSGVHQLDLDLVPGPLGRRH